MNRIQRGLAVLAGLSGTLFTLGAAAPVALATLPPPEPAPPVPVTVHTVVTGGMPGWQITLIAAGAALLAAALAVVLDRMWAARRRAIARTA
jgi:hypothetical protein